MPRTLKLTLAYDGADYHGWQVQPGLPTIQATVAEAIGRVTGENVALAGSGRTDAGVHALGQVASCELCSTIPAANLVIALNDLLPASIRVTNAEDALDGFHARYSARSKLYHYRILRSAICPPHVARYVYHHPYPLDERAMQEAAELAVGEHDFTAFAAADPEKRAVAARPEETSKTRSLSSEEQRAGVRRIMNSNFRRDGDGLVYAVEGNGFLHHMVRNLVGTFLLAGKGTLQPEDVTRILESRDRAAAGPTAPASGLWLMAVKY